MIAALGTIPQKLAEPAPLQATPLKPKSQMKAKSQKKVKPQKAKTGRPPGLTPATIRSAELTLRMRRDGMEWKEVAAERGKNITTMKRQVSRYKTSEAQRQKRDRN